MTEKREGGGCFLALVSKTLGEGEGGRDKVRQGNNKSNVLLEPVSQIKSQLLFSTAFLPLKTLWHFFPLPLLFSRWNNFGTLTQNAHISLCERINPPDLPQIAWVMGLWLLPWLVVEFVPECPRVRRRFLGGEFDRTEKLLVQVS